MGYVLKAIATIDANASENTNKSIMGRVNIHGRKEGRKEGMKEGTEGRKEGGNGGKSGTSDVCSLAVYLLSVSQSCLTACTYMVLWMQKNGSSAKRIIMRSEVKGTGNSDIPFFLDRDTRAGE